MNQSRTLAPLLALAVTLLPSFSVANDDSRERDNQLLNEGYSLLYSAVKGLRFSDDLLLIKVETERFNSVINHLADYADELTELLEQSEQNFPAVRLNVESLPYYEVKKRDAIGEVRIKQVLPYIGREGPTFERRLLLTSSGATNQLRYMCQQLAMAEPNAILKRRMEGCEQRFAELYDEVVVLLNEVYFLHNTFVPETEVGKASRTAKE